MNSKALKARLVISGLRVSDLLERLDRHGVSMSKSAFYRKLNGKSEFDRKEMLAIATELHFTNQELISIFFTEQVS